MKVRARLFSFLVLGVAALLSAVVLVFVLYHQDRLLNGVVRTVFFLGLPLAGFSFFLASFRFSAPARTLTAILIFSIGAAVYGFEVYTIFAAKPSVNRVPENVAFDRRGRYEVVNDLRAKGTDAYPAVFPAYLLRTETDGALHSPIELNGQEVLPLGGIAGVTTVMCNESGEYVIYESDEYGFNNPVGTWIKAEIEVAAVGDSYVQGYCIPREENFISLIGRAQPDTLNLGTSGSGPLMMLAALKEFLPPLSPPVVVWFFFEGNDIPGNLEIERRSPLLMRYLREKDFRQHLSTRFAAVDRRLAAFINAEISARPDASGTDAGPLQSAISFIGLSRTRAALRLPSTTGMADYPLFEEILREADETVAAWGGKLYFAYLPGFGSVAGTEGPRPDPHYGPITAIAGNLDIPVIDLWRSFAGHPDPASLFPFRSPNHYNAEGHALVAGEVLKVIGKR